MRPSAPAPGEEAEQTGSGQRQHHRRGLWNGFLAIHHDIV
jgi:hypothetical protein